MCVPFDFQGPLWILEVYSSCVLSGRNFSRFLLGVVTACSGKICGSGYKEPSIRNEDDLD